MSGGVTQADDIDQLDGDYLDTNLEIDYTRKSKRRCFRLEVGHVTFYIDPVEMSKKSPFFGLLTSNNSFVEAIDGSCRLYDRNNDIACMLQSICSTVYGIYPRIIRLQSIPTLARMADKYNLKNLQLSCEYFALRTNIRNYGNKILVKLLQTAFKYSYDLKLRESLIRELLIRSQFRNNLKGDKMTKEICKIIVKHSLKHSGKDTIGSVCRNCGRQKTSNTDSGNPWRLWQCERCNWIYCMHCKSTPCVVDVEEHLKNAFEKYEMEELRREAESQISAKRS